MPTSGAVVHGVVEGPNSDQPQDHVVARQAHQSAFRRCTDDARGQASEAGATQMPQNNGNS